MQPHDIDHLISLSRPSLAPDGSFAVHAASRPDLRANREVGQLWRIELEGDPAPRLLTRGLHDTAPVLSPDGATIAFLRADDEGRRQLHLLDARGGEPMRLTDLPLGVTGFAWTPDAARLVLTARDPEPGRYGTVEGLGPEAESPRRITRACAGTPTAWATRRTAPPRCSWSTPSPPGTEPIYPAAPHPGGELAPIPSAPAQAAQLTAAPAEHSSLAVPADGRSVLVVREAYERDRR